MPSAPMPPGAFHVIFDASDVNLLKTLSVLSPEMVTSPPAVSGETERFIIVISFEATVTDPVIEAVKAESPETDVV